MMNVLQTHGIYSFATANCTTFRTMEGWDDECDPVLAANVFVHYQKMKRLSPGNITFTALLPNANLPLWRDAADLVNNDEYPMFSTEPPTGYPLHLTYDKAVENQNAVMSSRPFVPTIQFFQFTALGRWPTQAELRSMSYAAIAGGANGLFYWSIGTGALAWVCTGLDAYHSPGGGDSWCQAKVDLHAILRNVITEMKGLEPVLILPDHPELLVGNSNSTIKTRVKLGCGAAYLIAYNASNSTQAVSLTWTSTISNVAVPQEGRNLTQSNKVFSDTFTANAARVYVIY